MLLNSKGYKKGSVKFTQKFIDSLPKNIDTLTGCWLYSGYINPSSGYGSIKSNYKPYLVHRLVASIVYNKDYNDIKWMACHIIECRNRHCFNPVHLYIGDAYSNMKDSVISKTHKEARKIKCPKCGSSYREITLKSGPRKGKVKRVCTNCRTNSMRVWRNR